MSEMKVWAGLVCPEASFLGLEKAHLLAACSRVLCSVHACPDISSYKDTNLTGLEPHPNSLILT